METNISKTSDEKKEVNVENNGVSESQTGDGLVEDKSIQVETNPAENLDNYSLLDEKEDTIEFFKSHIEWTLRQGRIRCHIICFFKINFQDMVK